jgi:hypothetical protein
MSASDKAKLDGVASGAEVNVNADWTAASGDAQILNKPNSFTPTAHKSSHGTDGADRLTYSDIGLNFDVEQNVDVTDSTGTSLSGNPLFLKNAIRTLTNNNASRRTVNLTGVVASGDKLLLRCIGTGGGIRVEYINTLNQPIFLTNIDSGQQYQFVFGLAGSQTWQILPVSTHPASAIADSTTAGRALLTAGTVQSQRTALDIFLSYANLAALPASGNFQRVYLALDTQKTYVWNGSGYTETSPNTHTRNGIASNIGVGETALPSASLSAANCTAVGFDSLKANTTGASNVAIGTLALQSNVGGSGNTAVGSFAMASAAETASNTSLGSGSLYSHTVGSSNVGVGLNAGFSLTQGNKNTFLGTSSDVDATGIRNLCVCIGHSTVSPAVDGSLAIGGTAGNVMGNLVATTSGTNAGKDLVIYLNGTRYLIALKT